MAAAALGCASSAAVAESYGDWELSCPEGLTCRLTQTTADRDGNTVMQTLVGVDGSKKLFLQITVPNSVALTEGPWLTVDGLFLTELTYQNCPGGCVAQIPITAFLLSSLTSGSLAKVTVARPDSTRVGISMSLTGLKDGIAALDSRL